MARSLVRTVPVVSRLDTRDRLLDMGRGERIKWMLSELRAMVEEEERPVARYAWIRANLRSAIWFLDAALNEYRHRGEGDEGAHVGAPVQGG